MKKKNKKIAAITGIAVGIIIAGSPWNIQDHGEHK